jgi:hypothetical protein
VATLGSPCRWVLGGEGVALVVAKRCPLEIFQRRAGDDMPMFELWFGPRLAPFAIPAFSSLALLGAALVFARSRPDVEIATERTDCPVSFTADRTDSP